VIRLATRQHRGLCVAAVLLLVLGGVAPVRASDEPTSTTASQAVAAPEAAGGTESQAAATPPAPPPRPAPVSLISASDPLNGGFLIVNMHGMLFHPLDSDVQEDVAYARWLGSGVIRVFATDNNGFLQWDGNRVGKRIADLAPVLRAGHERLIVALVNNHRAVPGEAPEAAGWMDNYLQLLLPFYTTTWHGAYLQFVRDLIRTVENRQALDVVYAWELGNELHTPRDPGALAPFITQATQEVRKLDTITPVLPGTMGANHLEPGNPNSPLARWLYCEAPIDAYTLHAYDWVSIDRQGDMPIEWDLDNIIKAPCPSGGRLPVIVEELGTSRSLDGVYTATDEARRLAQELHQIEFIRRYPQVAGFGIWNGESPRLVDKTFLDSRRGMTSYGSQAQGGGSCYDPTPDASPGVRCQLEQALRQLRFVRLGTPDQWAPGPDASPQSPIVGRIDPVASGDSAASLALSGWVADPSAEDTAGVDQVSILLGAPGQAGPVLAQARLGLARPDLAANPDDPGLAGAGFSVNVPLDSVPVGLQTFTLQAHTAEHGTWLTTLQVVVPSLGGVAASRPKVVVSAVPAPAVSAAASAHLMVNFPGANDSVNRSLTIQGSAAPGIDSVQVFLEPDRDNGGRMIGSASRAQLADTAFQASVEIPSGGAHTLYVHVHSASTGKEEITSVPVRAR
jgi:hypothetical protein